MEELERVGIQFLKGVRIQWSKLSVTKEEVYCHIHKCDIPLCICGKPLRINRMVVGFRSACSVQCANIIKGTQYKGTDKCSVKVDPLILPSDITKEFIDDNLESTGNISTNMFKKLSFIISSAECYNIYYDFHPTGCKVCGGKTSFMGFKSGYRPYCSTACSGRDSDRIDKLKVSQLLLDNNGLNSYDRGIQTRISNNSFEHVRKIHEDSGHWIPLDMKNDQELYYRQVHLSHNPKLLKKLKHYSKRGHANITDSYQLDHKFSIFNGFKNNILPIYIGNINNLEMIKSIDNLKKGRSNSISLEILFEDFES